MVTKERLAQGMTVQQYVDQMTVNRERFVSALETITVSTGEIERLAPLAGTRHVLVITEDWCGAAIASMPYVVKLVEQMRGADMRVFLRDENPDLMDQFLKNGMYRAIPVFAFFDEQMNELGRFIERRPS